jgi:hypothetical protein
MNKVKFRLGAALVGAVVGLVFAILTQGGTNG